MREIDRTVIRMKSGFAVGALTWHGDDLVDWGGIVRYRLDGTSSGPRVNYPYRFNRAAASRNGKYVVLYEQLGTKGIILKAEKFVREIDRSYYHAHVYEYPVALFTLADGTDAIAHCPEHYNVIEIEEVESGKRLTPRLGEAADFFHSRFQVSPDGRYLLSAGWYWHPFDYIQLFDLEQALRAPESLDKTWRGDLGDDDEIREIHSAAFNGPDLMVFAGNNEEDKPQLGVYSIEANKVISSCVLESPVGTLMPLGDVAVSFFEHPKLLDLATGNVLHRWPELSTGMQNSSIVYHLDRVPPMALDPLNSRFAVVDSEVITVIQLG